MGSTGDRTFYAKWTEVKYKITYNLDGGTNNIQNPASYTITSEVVFQNPAKKGYIFKGWFKDSQFAEIVTGINHELGDKTVYAKWEAQQYVITYELNGGDNSPKNPAGYTCKDTFILQPATMARHTFDGWYQDRNFKSRE